MGWVFIKKIKILFFGIPILIFSIILFTLVVYKAYVGFSLDESELKTVSGKINNYKYSKAVIFDVDSVRFTYSSNTFDYFGFKNTEYDFDKELKYLIKYRTFAKTNVIYELYEMP